MTTPESVRLQKQGGKYKTLDAVSLVKNVIFKDGAELPSIDGAFVEGLLQDAIPINISAERYLICEINDQG